jgi:hypothetical protein
LRFNKLTSRKNSIILFISFIFATIIFISYWTNQEQKHATVSNDRRASSSNSGQTNNQQVEKATYSFINVSDFGAIGDGKHNDTKAILKAIDQVKDGGNIIFDSNRTYLITQTIKISKDITLTTNGQKNATLLMGSNRKQEPVLYFTGKVKDSFKIDTTLRTRNNHIKLSNIKNIDSDDLLLVESDTPWYFDPRTGTQNLHKGELHKIMGVNNSEVILAEGLWDTYNPNEEQIEAKLIDPIKVNLEKINVIRATSNNRTIGIKLEYSSNSTLNKVTVRNSTSTGILVLSSYRTIVQDSSIVGANDKFSGYGIQTYGTSYSTIKDNRVTGSRRGIDVSGYYPDYYSTVEFNTVYGGGKNEFGLNYITEDTQYGVGSHSTANFTVFRGNILGNLNYGINIRSTNVNITQNKFLGLIRGSCIILSYGKNVSIVDNETISGNQVPSFATNMELPKNIKNFNASTFLIIKSSYKLNDSQLLIKENRANDISREFIKLLNAKESTSSQIKSMDILNNKISSVNSNNKFYLINSEFPVIANSCRLSNNLILDHTQKQLKESFYNFKIKKSE